MPINLPLVVGYLTICLLVAYIGHDKTLKFWGNLILSLLLSPIIGLLIIAFEKRIDETRAKAAEAQHEHVDAAA
jgi:small neutral amino acid transporter SnatA (MarC family)